MQTNGAGSTKWILRAGVTDRQWAAIKIGNKALVSSASSEKSVQPGLVSRKAEAVDPATGLFSVDITITDNFPKAIAYGMFGKSVISISGESDLKGKMTANWHIPYEAVLDADGSSGYVFITNDNKTAQKVKVVIAGIEKNGVIISQGLEGAKAIIISGSAYLSDNSLIHVIL